LEQASSLAKHTSYVGGTLLLISLKSSSLGEVTADKQQQGRLTVFFFLGRFSLRFFFFFFFFSLLLTLNWR
jgi:hypothetical protein